MGGCVYFEARNVSLRNDEHSDAIVHWECAEICCPPPLASDNASVCEITLDDILGDVLIGQQFYLSMAVKTNHTYTVSGTFEVRRQDDSGIMLRSVGSLSFEAIEE